MSGYNRWNEYTKLFISTSRAITSEIDRRTACWHVKRATVRVERLVFRLANAAERWLDRKDDDIQRIVLVFCLLVPVYLVARFPI